MDDPIRVLKYMKIVNELTEPLLCTSSLCHFVYSERVMGLVSPHSVALVEHLLGNTSEMP